MREGEYRPNLNEEPPSIEALDTRKNEPFHYGQYLRHLGLKESDIRDRTILDIGAGTRVFAGYCYKNGINLEVYSIDPYLKDESYLRYNGHIWDEETRRHVDAHSVVGSYENIPFQDKSFDLILVHAATPGYHESDDPGVGSSIARALKEMCRVMNQGGEIKIYPYFESPTESEHQWVEPVNQEVETLRSAGEYDITIERLSRREYGGYKQGADRVCRLIIRRRSSKRPNKTVPQRFIDRI